MREIKFRALAPKIDGKWHYGSLLENTQYDFDSYIVEDDAIKILIDRETVGQFTGLYDKNGKKIYEGDIVFIKGEVEILDIKGKIEYSETFAQYIITNTGDIVNEAEPLGDYENIEIIGNIYDNPDLLEKGKEE